jgi:hypothetical protein
MRVPATNNSTACHFGEPFVLDRRLHFTVYRDKGPREPCYGAKMQRVSEVLQLSIKIERRRSLPLEPQTSQKFDFVLSYFAAE